MDGANSSAGVVAPRIQFVDLLGAHGVRRRQRIAGAVRSQRVVSGTAMTSAITASSARR